jgi:hypothetical protein
VDLKQLFSTQKDLLVSNSLTVIFQANFKNKKAGPSLPYSIIL